MRLRVLIITFLILLEACSSGRKAIKKDYDIKKIKKVIVAEFAPYSDAPNSGSVVADIFAQKLLECGYEVIGREFIKRQTSFDNVLKTAKKYNVDVIITGTVTKYSIEKKIHKVPAGEKEIQVSGETNQVTVKEKEEKIVVTHGQMYGPDTQLPYEIEATVGIIAKMIDVKTGEVVWVDRAESRAFSIEAAVEGAVDILINSFNEE